MSKPHRLDKEQLTRVEQTLRAACGVRLPHGVRETLQLSFRRAANAVRLEPEAFLERLLAAETTAITALVENSVIGETYFARHPEHFAVLREHLLPDFGPVERLRVWCAGCSSGEEAYGLALSLLEVGRRDRADVVLGTDVSEHALERARAGRYGKWALRRLDAFSRRYLTLEGAGAVVKTELRGRVQFRRNNLLLDPPPMTDVHVLFCRNVLIYFEPDDAIRVLHKLASALAPGGYLMLGVAELPFAATLELEWRDLGDVTVLRRPLQGEALARPALTLPPPTPVQPSLSPAPRVAPPNKPTRSPRPTGQLPAEPPETDDTAFGRARAAAREGRADEAERLARQSATEELRPEAYLLLAMLAETRGDLDESVRQVRRALYLNPHLAMAHAMLVTLFLHLGKSADAERSRRNALRELAKMEESALVEGVERISVSALKRALET